MNKSDCFYFTDFVLFTTVKHFYSDRTVTVVYGVNDVNKRAETKKLKVT